MLTVFFVVSCAVQAAAGFLVDRFGPRPVLYVGLVAIAVSCFGSALSTSYWMLTFFAGLAGLGNGVFHPVDYTLLNRRISAHRLGHAYSAHGITGTLGWAIAPALMTGVALAHSWQASMAARLWTRGWDFFAPTEHVIFHLWSRAGRRGTFWEIAEVAEARKRSQARVARLLTSAEADGGADEELGPYGLGTQRTLRAFEEMCGVSFATRSVSSKAGAGSAAIGPAVA
jgi:MFS family permease